MRKPKALIEALAKIEALEAQLKLGRTMYRTLRDSRAVDERVCGNAHGARSNNVMRWTDVRGNVWEKTRTGNRATSRMVPASDAINSIAAEQPSEVTP